MERDAPLVGEARLQMTGVLFHCWQKSENALLSLEAWKLDYEKNLLGW